jgi:site-specific recombinase XerD
LRGRFLERFAGRSPETLKRAEIQALLDDMIDDGKATSANRMLAAVRKLLNWAVERGELDFLPVLAFEALRRKSSEIAS